MFLVHLTATSWFLMCHGGYQSGIFKHSRLHIVLFCFKITRAIFLFFRYFTDQCLNLNMQKILDVGEIQFVYTKQLKHLAQ